MPPVAVAALLTCALGCAAASPLERVIAARGGPLPALARTVEADVQQGFPGSWRWRTVFQVPDRYAWTIETVAEPDHYVFDGEAVRAFVGSREVSVDTSPLAPLRSHARLMAVIGLDALGLPGITTSPVPDAELPEGVASGLDVRFDDDADGARYRLCFDRRGLLVRASGVVAVPPFGTGEVEIAFDDFRPAARWTLPYRWRWQLRGSPLATERVLAACPDPPGLGPQAFRTSSSLPACPAP